MKKISQNWQNLPTSIFSRMTQESIKFNAVNLAQGFPDFDGPTVIKEAAIAAIQNGDNQYAPSAGISPLREKVSAFEEKNYQLSYDPDSETTIFSGATEAIFCSILALCNPQDEIITFEPFYDSYLACALAAHSNLVTVPLQAPTWDFSIDKLNKSINERTKVILLNSPHNPTGKVFSLNELEQIRAIAIENDLYIVTDEVYEKLVFSPYKHTPIASLPDMKERTITISSTSKTFSFTGWKVGYAFASPLLSAAIRKVHQYTVFCSATPLQVGMLAAFDLRDLYYREMLSIYNSNKELLFAALTESGFKCLKPQGTYFITGDFSSISEQSDEDFSLWMTREIGVACIPLSAFYLDPEKCKLNSKIVRFGFCKDEKTLQLACKKIRHLKGL